MKLKEVRKAVMAVVDLNEHRDCDNSCAAKPLWERLRQLLGSPCRRCDGTGTVVGVVGSDKTDECVCPECKGEGVVKDGGTDDATGDIT